MGDEHRADSVTDDIVRFFEALAPDDRAAYDGLAERDRRFGEDVDREIAS